MLKITKKFDLIEIFDWLCEVLCKEMEALSKDTKFITNCLKTIQANPSVLERIFPTFAFLLENNPKLLEKLWDKASKNKNG